MGLPRQVGLIIEYDGTGKSGGVKGASETQSNTISGDSGTYTVVSGDTLWAIAKKYYGSGKDYPIIYNANRDLIEETAKQHGKGSSQNGHWIWPGETLTIPDAGQGTGKRQTAGETAGVSNPELGEMIAKQTEQFSYIDVSSGESDSISLTISDIGKDWMGKYKPMRGAHFGAKLNLQNWDQEKGNRLFDCGTFVLDDISFSGRPLVCSLGAVSIPAMDDFKSMDKTNTWESTTIRDIAAKITESYGISLCYDAGSVEIAEIEQNKQTDSAFLYSLCEKYGLGMKVYHQKIVIFDIGRYEEKEAAWTLSEEEMLRWDYTETVDGTYTGVTLSYTNPDVKDDIDITLGSSGRMYAMNVQASSRYDAELQAAAMVNDANRRIETMEVTIKGNPDLIATQCIRIEGLQSLDGKYYIDKIKHNIGDSGYTMTLTMHRVQAGIGKRQTDSGTSGTYTVVSGDTLWAIAKKYYGSGKDYPIIYNANRDLIEETAKQHGKGSSQNGHWIWPGETLTIPIKG